jgi:hypothetical protein
MPTIKVILANKIAPGLLDRYLASAAYSGQLTDEPAAPDAPANLYQTVDGAYEAHGRFDKKARSFAWEMMLSRHRGAGFVLAASLFGYVFGRWLTRDR